MYVYKVLVFGMNPAQDGCHSRTILVNKKVSFTVIKLVFWLPGLTYILYSEH